MEMTGEQLIPATQADTWAALNDPEVLKACISGCESIEKVGRKEAAGHAHDAQDSHDDHHPEPVPRDPDLPTVKDSTLAFFAAGALVVFAVSLVTLV